MKMKKSFVLVAASALFLASCSSDAFLGEEPVVETKGTPINFNPLKSNSQKGPATGTTAATLLKNKFVVYGANSAPVFDNYLVTYTDGSAGSTQSNTAGWEYVGNTSLKGAIQDIKYWDKSQAKYQFVAVSGLTGSEVITNEQGFNVNVDLNKAGNVYVSDRVTVLPANYGNTVTMSFRRLTSRIRVGLYETVPGYAVKDVKFYYTTKASGAAEAGLGSNFLTNAAYTVSYDAHDSAHVSYGVTGTTQRYLAFGNLAYTSAASKAGDAAKPYLGADGKPAATAANAYLGTSSTTATFAKGSYTIDGVADVTSDYRPILPDEEHDCPMYLNVDFTLVPEDGSANNIIVYQASAVVPAQYCQWKPNYSYTYLFKISNKVNGTTDPTVPTFPTDPSDPTQPIDPTNPEDPSVPTTPTDQSLYAITFDAVVADVIDNTQQTITTVSTPGITTYQLGVDNTATDEYKAGEAIYVTGVVNNVNSSAVQLFQVTAGEATEALAELAYNAGKSDPSTDNYDKTTLKMTQIYGTAVTQVPLADGTKLTIPAMSFSPAAAGTFVARFENAGKVAYKVIKVQ